LTLVSDLRYSSADGVFELRAAGIIVRRPTSNPADARVLMVTSTANDYAYSVGGAVEFGETLREAAAREIFEETGAPLPVGDLAAVEQLVFTEEGRVWHVVAYHYWVDVPDDFIPAEHFAEREGVSATLRWLSASDLHRMTFYPACYADALNACWDGVRYFVERNQHVTETAI